MISVKLFGWGVLSLCAIGCHSHNERLLTSEPVEPIREFIVTFRGYDPMEDYHHRSFTMLHKMLILAAQYKLEEEDIHIQDWPQFDAFSFSCHGSQHIFFFDSRYDFTCPTHALKNYYRQRWPKLGPPPNTSVGVLVYSGTIGDKDFLHKDKYGGGWDTIYQQKMHFDASLYLVPYSKLSHSYCESGGRLIWTYSKNATSAIWKADDPSYMAFQDEDFPSYLMSFHCDVELMLLKDGIIR